MTVLQIIAMAALMPIIAVGTILFTMLCLRIVDMI